MCSPWLVAPMVFTLMIAIVFQWKMYCSGKFVLEVPRNFLTGTVGNGHQKEGVWNTKFKGSEFKGPISILRGPIKKVHLQFGSWSDSRIKIQTIFSVSIRFHLAIWITMFYCYILQYYVATETEYRQRFCIKYFSQWVLVNTCTSSWTHKKVSLS